MQISTATLRPPAVRTKTPSSPGAASSRAVLSPDDLAPVSSVFLSSTLPCAEGAHGNSSGRAAASQKREDETRLDS